MSPSTSKRKPLHHQTLSIPEHQEWIKRGQRILGGLLWLSTRTRPDLAYSVSSTAQVLTRDLELVKDKASQSTSVSELYQDHGSALPFPKEAGDD